jgi:hypothetical protein
MGSMTVRGLILSPILGLALLVSTLPAHAGEALEITPENQRGEWDWARRGLGIVSVTLFGAGATFTALAFSELYSVDDTVSGAERVAINGRIDDYNAAAVTCYTVAATALVVYLVWKLWPADDPVVRAGPGGLQLSVRF